MRCIEALRKNVCSIRVATTKIMKKAYTKSVMWPSTAGAGGWVGGQYTHFTESKIAVLCMCCSIVLIGVIDNHFCYGGFLRIGYLSFLI